MLWGGVKTLSKACAVPLLLSPVFFSSLVNADPYPDSATDPIVITNGQNYSIENGGTVNKDNQTDSWISNTDGTFSGSWDSVNFSTSSDKIISTINTTVENNETAETVKTEIYLSSENGENKLSNSSTDSTDVGIYNNKAITEIISRCDLILETVSSLTGKQKLSAIKNVNSFPFELDPNWGSTKDEEQKEDMSDIQADSNLSLNIDGDLNITTSQTTSNNLSEAYGIYSKLENLGQQHDYDYVKNANTNISANNIIITTKTEGSGNTSGIYIKSEGSGNTLPPPFTMGGLLSGQNKINIKSENLTINSDTGIKIDNRSGSIADLYIESKFSNTINFGYNHNIADENNAINILNGSVHIKAENGDNRFETDFKDLKSGQTIINVTGGQLTIEGVNNYFFNNVREGGGDGGPGGIYGSDNLSIENSKHENKMEILAVKNNEISSTSAAVRAKGNYSIRIETSGENGLNIIKAYNINNSNINDNQQYYIVGAEDGGQIELLAIAGTNLIKPNTEIKNLYVHALRAGKSSGVGQSSEYSGQIELRAKNNILYGSVLSEDGSLIKIEGQNNYIKSGNWRGKNKDAFRYGLFTTNNVKNSENSSITVTATDNGVNNIVLSDSIYSGTGYTNITERVVYAADKGIININGTSNISTASWIDDNASGYQYNSTSMALVAAASEDSGEFVEDPNSLTNDDRSHINLNYGKGSTITGDIVSGYGGDIQITEQASANTASARAVAPAMTIRGNVLAGNGGKLNLELGEGSFWYGRADDYQDAGEDHGDGADNSFYNPAFSNEITSSGTVDVKLATNATWKMLGQSWLTSLENNGVVDLSNEFVSSTTDSEVSIENTHALTVQKLTGNGTFVMSLDHTDHANSDMLYAKNATGTYTLQLKEMPNGWENIDKDNALRFATLQGGATFNPEVAVVNQGAQNYKLLIEARPYEVNDEENAEYNGDGGLTLAKPGQDNVDDFFELSEDKGEEITTVSLAKVNEESVDALAEETVDSAASEINNFVISQAVSTGLSDIGRTILNMSRANYANAVYMDTLNKRQGEARFGMSEDNGVWVRLRHDNIGKEDSFRTHNTMLELGYDIKNLVEGGQWHTGIALDYMNGQSDYHNVSGDGDIQRYGAWFYSTWLSDSGHYADFVLKYGHLKNDFDIYTPEGYNVTGDYSNNVVSISGEYGYKFANAAGWFAEPQVQLQYSYVSEADYTTSQGTKVEVDSIDSLIARAGVRLGKDFNAEYPISLYLRADVLHEFLGDQDLSAIDESRIDVTYENDDTWYSAGVGLSVMTSPNTYFFIEGEQVFGADNDDTYTLSGGFRHNF